MKSDYDGIDVAVETVNEFFRRRERNWMWLNILVGIFCALMVTLCVLSFIGCGGTARVNKPAAVYDELTVEEYAAAEEHFAGGKGALGSMASPPPPPDIYWNDTHCQELLIRRDGCLIAAAGLGVLTGAGGLATALPPDASREAKMGIGYSTLGLAAISAAITLAVTQMNNRFEENCRQERDAPPEHPASDEVDPDSETTVELIAPDAGVEP